VIAIHDDVLGAIGRTPMVRLRRVVLPLLAEGGAEVLAKLEYLGPGGSVKDRAALAMVVDGEQRGALRPGGTVVEASAGNTGVGLALVCAVRGYRCVIVLPEGTSPEKLAVLGALGAEIVLARADVEPGDAEGYIGRAERLANELSAFLPDQFGNLANPDAHFATTGPEIVLACGGKLDAFVACVGSGGTLGGVARYLKEHAPHVRIVGAAPDVASSTAAHGSSLVEGITPDLASCAELGVDPDEIVTVGDRDAVAMTLRLAREEGILAGGSAGLAVQAALALAKRLGPGKRVVTLLPDTGRNYLSTLFDPAWRSERGL
jgi:cysteine synthase